MAKHVDYINMTKKQSESAFREYLDERGPALERLREALVADGQDPDAILDGSIESLVPLWRWILAHLTVFDAPGGATDPNSVPREQWPSWARHEYEVMHSLSLESLFLLDGLVSYLGDVVQQHAPEARWEIARHRIKRYHLNKHPVLVSGTGEDHHYLPGLPRVHAYSSLTGFRESPDDTMAEYARRLIEQLNRGDIEDEEMAEEEPLVEVEDLGDDEIRGRELEVSLREDIGHEHSRVVDRMVKALKQEDGITRAHREDREVLLVATPSWSTDRLHQWVSNYLENKISD
ncbi:hypothetical protein [Arthrobacter sp. D1-17]